MSPDWCRCRALTAWVAVGWLGLGLGCGVLGGGGEPTVEQVEPEPATLEERVGRIAGAIDRDPGAREAILQERGMSPEAYEKALYEIAMDPKRTAAFEQARRGE